MMDDDDEHESAASAIDALAGAALAALPATNPRIHSARHDVPVSALDPLDAPSIGMIYGLNRHDDARVGAKRRKMSSNLTPAEADAATAPTGDDAGSDDQPDPSSRLASPTPAGGSDAESTALISRLDSLQQYAEVGLQHSKDALRVLAGVAVDSREPTMI